MSRTVFLVALTVLCLTEIHGRYAKDPRFYDRFGKDQGFVVKAADESNGKEVIMKLIRTYISLLMILK